MDSVIIDSTKEVESPHFSSFIINNYETVLKDSIDCFLRQISSRNFDFSHFRSVFFRLLQSKEDPPLEIMWFYTAVSFHDVILSENEALNKVLVARDLFQFLSSCSSSSKGTKSIALLAPVLSNLYKSVEKSSENFSSKQLKKLRREIENLTEGIIGYVSICCSKGFIGNDSRDNLLSCFHDLLRVWSVDSQQGRIGEFREDLRSFFPLVTESIRERFSEEGCEINYLSGVVILEAFLLSLCWKIRRGDTQPDFLNNLRIWAVGSVTGFRNHIFFGMLLNLLVEPNLSITPLLSSTDESILRELLYDTVILVDYSFLKEIDTNDDQMTNIATAWLIVTLKAVHISRESGNKEKAISYMNAFSRSHLPSFLVNCARTQIDTGKLTDPDISTPQSLLKWLIEHEGQGLKVSAYDLSSLFSSSVLDDKSKTDYHHPLINTDTKLDTDLFFIDKKGDISKNDKEIVGTQSMDSMFLAAAHAMKFTSYDDRRKRKEQKKELGKTKVKFTKYELHETSLEHTNSNDNSEVENPDSDVDMNEADQ